MIFKDLLDHFNIEGNFPPYLLNQTFNEVFLDGKYTKEDNAYIISITTRQDVTHRMLISPEDNFPVTVISELPNGLLNGMKFGQREGDVEYVSEL